MAASARATGATTATHAQSGVEAGATVGLGVADEATIPRWSAETFASVAAGEADGKRTVTAVLGDEYSRIGERFGARIGGGFGARSYDDNAGFHLRGHVGGLWVVRRGASNLVLVGVEPFAGYTFGAVSAGELGVALTIELKHFFKLGDSRHPLPLDVL